MTPARSGAILAEVRAALSDGPLSFRALRTRIGRGWDPARAALRALVDAGEVVQEGQRGRHVRFALVVDTPPSQPLPDVVLPAVGGRQVEVPGGTSFPAVGLPAVPPGWVVHAVPGLRPGWIAWEPALPAEPLPEDGPAAEVPDGFSPLAHLADRLDASKVESWEAGPPVAFEELSPQVTVEDLQEWALIVSGDVHLLADAAMLEDA